MPDAQKEELNLDTISDLQKVLLSSIAYLDISDEGLALIQKGGLKLSELEPYLSQANIKASGDFSIGDPQTDHDLWNNLIKTAGFGDLVITDVTSHSETGFQAFTFEDQAGNTGITYRGSDFDFEKGGHLDWLSGNIGEHFIGESNHGEEAIKYFEEHCDTSGSNYIYGYSLGGNQVQHAFVEHYDMIAEAFSLNGNSISPALLDTKEKIAAFNSDRFNCCIVEGDIIGMSKQNELYKENINVIKNNGQVTTNFMNAHGQGAITYDANQNFVTIPYEQMIENVKKVYQNADIGVEFNLFGKDFEIDFGFDNAWELVAFIQQAGIKSAEIHENVRDAVDGMPEPVQDGLAYLSALTDLPMFGIITDPKESMQQYQDFLSRTGHLAQKYLPGAEDLARLEIFNLPAKMFKNGAELFNKAAGQVYQQLTDGKKTIIGVAKDAVFAPDKLIEGAQEKLRQIKGFDFGKWAQNVMEKSGLAPMLKNRKVVETVDDLKQWGKEAIECFDSISDAPEWLRDALETGIENSWLAQVVEHGKDIDLGTLCGTVVEKAKDIDLKEIGTTAVENIKDGFDYVGDKLQDGYEYVQNGLEDAGEAIENWIEDIGNRFK